MKYSFNNMEAWDMKQLREVRRQLRDELAAEIQKRNSIKAEIVFLQNEIEKFNEN